MSESTESDETESSTEETVQGEPEDPEKKRVRRQRSVLNKVIERDPRGLIAADTAQDLLRPFGYQLSVDETARLGEVAGEKFSEDEDKPVISIAGVVVRATEALGGNASVPTYKRTDLTLIARYHANIPKLTSIIRGRESAVADAPTSPAGVEFADDEKDAEGDENDSVTDEGDGPEHEEERDEGDSSDE